MSAVTVWSKPACVQCKAVYRAFDKAGVVYEVKNLPDFPEQIERFKVAGLTSAPVVVAAGHDPFAGFNPDAVKAVVAEYGTPAAA
jgi:glutaredoxin-like protein NrdH